MDDEESTEVDVTPETLAFMGQPMTRTEVVRLVQPLRAALLSTFHGTMTSLAMIALQARDSETKDKARNTFKELHEVFAEIDAFDARLSKLLKGDPTWCSDDKDATND